MEIWIPTRVKRALPPLRGRPTPTSRRSVARWRYATCYTEGFSHFVTSMTAPVASGWSVSPGGALIHRKAPRFTAQAGERAFRLFILSDL